MRYTKEERLDIGRRIYNGELTVFAAAVEYDMSEHSARSYMRMYRDVNHLPSRVNQWSFQTKVVSSESPSGLEDYEAMSKEQLIQELVKSRITEARLKKGYEVKGVGADKKYIPLDNKNIK